MEQGEVREDVPLQSVSPPPPTTITPKVTYTSWIKLSAPNNFDSNRVQGHTFLMLCELYISLTKFDFFNDQVECIIRQEMKTGQMMFIDWNTFTSEFALVFCAENEAMMALMRLKSDCYLQGRHNMEAYIDEFKHLVDMSGYIDPIAIVLKFHRGLNVTTQDRIAKSGTDRPRDNDFES
jgi:hypothetical protein